MYRSGFRTTSTVLPVVLLLLGACNSDAPTEPQLSPALSRSSAVEDRIVHVAVCPTTQSHRADGVIGPRGGSLRVAGHRLMVPAGVLTEPTRFTISAPAGRQVKLELMANGAEHFQFAAPVAVTISYDRCRRQHPDAAASVWFVDDSGTTLLEPMVSKDDRNRKAVTFSTSHFSTYLVAY